MAAPVRVTFTGWWQHGRLIPEDLQLLPQPQDEDGAQPPAVQAPEDARGSPAEESIEPPCVPPPPPLPPQPLAQPLEDHEQPPSPPPSPLPSQPPAQPLVEHVEAPSPPPLPSQPPTQPPARSLSITEQLYEELRQAHAAAKRKTRSPGRVDPFPKLSTWRYPAPETGNTRGCKMLRALKEGVGKASRKPRM